MSQTPDPTQSDDSDLARPSTSSAPLDTSGSGEPAATPDTAPAAPAPAAKADNPLRASRTSGFYTAVVALGIVLVLLIIFIVQNTADADVHYFGFDGSAPQAVLLLIALAAGIFLTATASTLRLLQVRRRVKRDRKSRR